MDEKAVEEIIDGATFILYSLLLPEAFKAGSGEVLSSGQIVLQSFVVPLVTMLPFVIAVIIKWRRLSYAFRLVFQLLTRNSFKV